MTVREAALFLSVSKDTIQNMIHKGVFVAWRPNPQGRKQLLLFDEVKAHRDKVVIEAATRAKRLRQTEFDF